MKDMDMRARFIELRAAGWSFARIAAELQVAKQTLVDWSRQYQFQIQNLRALHLEGLQEKYLASHESRLQMMGSQFKHVEDELATRKLSDVPTARLLALASTLRREMARETAPPQFSSPANEIPSEERVYSAHDWRA